MIAKDIQVIPPLIMVTNDNIKQNPQKATTQIPKKKPKKSNSFDDYLRFRDCINDC